MMSSSKVIASDLPNGAAAIRTKAIRTDDSGWSDELYHPAANIQNDKIT
jgi:hypothetical protein